MLPYNPGGHAAFQDALSAAIPGPIHSQGGWLIPGTWLLPVTAPLSVLPHSSAKSASAIVRRKAVLLVTVNAIIPSPTVTGDGTLTGNVISSATTSTCMWLPIPTMISLCFRF